MHNILHFNIVDQNLLYSKRRNQLQSKVYHNKDKAADIIDVMVSVVKDIEGSSPSTLSFIISSFIITS